MNQRNACLEELLTRQLPTLAQQRGPNPAAQNCKFYTYDFQNNVGKEFPMQQLSLIGGVDPLSHYSPDGYGFHQFCVVNPGQQPLEQSQLEKGYCVIKGTQQIKLNIPENTTMEFLGWIQKPIATVDSPKALEASAQPETPLEKYNSYFKTNVTNLNEFSADNLKNIKACFAAIRECKPSQCSYVYLNSKPTSEQNLIFTFVQTNIKGMENNQCLIETTETDPYYQNPTAVIRCKYDTKSLSMMTDTIAEFNASFGSYDESKRAEIEAFQNVTKSQCCMAAPDNECGD